MYRYPSLFVIWYQLYKDVLFWFHLEWQKNVFVTKDAEKERVNTTHQTVLTDFNMDHQAQESLNTALQDKAQIVYRVMELEVQ